MSHGNGNTTNGTTGWVRSLEERMCARPIHLFTLIVGVNERPKHYKVRVLQAEKGDKWINDLDACNQEFDNGINGLRIREQFETAILNEEMAVMNAPDSPDEEKLNAATMYDRRVKLEDKRIEQANKLKIDRNVVQTKYQNDTLNMLFAYDEKLAADRDEIESSGLTHEQIYEAMLRLVYSTDPTKVQQSLGLEIAKAHGIA